MYLIYGLTATVLFALAATVSLMFLTPPPNKNPEPSKPGATKASEGMAAEPEASSKLRPLLPAKASPEDMAHIYYNQQERERQIKQKEEAINGRQQQMEMILQDIKGERHALDELRKQISEELNQVSKKLEDIESKKQSTAQIKAEIEKKEKADKEHENDNVKKLVPMFEGMSPEGAARILENMANNGRIEDVARILIDMKGGKAAKVMEAMSDASLTAQITARIRVLRQSIKPADTNPVPGSNPPQ